MLPVPSPGSRPGDAIWAGNGDSLRPLGGRGSSLEPGDSIDFPCEPPGDFNFNGGVDVRICELGEPRPSSSSNLITSSGRGNAAAGSDGKPEAPSDDINDSSTIWTSPCSGKSKGSAGSLAKLYVSCRTAEPIHHAYLHYRPPLADERLSRISVPNSRCDHQMDVFQSLPARAKEGAS